MRREGDEPTVIPVRLDDVLEGKWKLVRKIGEGGMGTVYLAHDLALDRPVAVKILSSALMGDPEVVARFEREARLTASLEHPNIVPVYAVGRYEGRPFIVMKKLEGETLAGVLRQKGGFSLAETVSLMRQLCSGLEFIHAKSYVHRDIKAGNIFLAPGGLATILDFGILRPSRSTEALTRTGVVMGTPQYMSPEQALGARDVDHRADLYALAVVLYECLTGTLPFEADSELQLVQMHAHQPPPDMLARAPWISRAVADVVARALAKRPEDRYPTAGELLAALEAAHAGAAPTPAVVTAGPRPPAPSTPPPPSAHTVPSLRKRAELATGTPPLPVPGLATPVGAASFARQERPRRLPLLAAIGLLGLALAAGAYRWTGPEELPAVGDPPLTLAADSGGDHRPDAADLASTLASAPDAAVEDAGGELALGGADGGDWEDEPPDAGTKAAGKRPSVRHPVLTGNGKVNVVTTHGGEPYWALVLVDGVARGRTPLLIELPPGKHLIRVDRTGFRSEERQIKVASGRLAVVRIALTQ